MLALFLAAAGRRHSWDYPGSEHPGIQLQKRRDKAPGPLYSMSESTAHTKQPKLHLILGNRPPPIRQASAAVEQQTSSSELP